MVEFRGVVKIIVYNDDNKVLVLRRNAKSCVFPDMWDLPGGKIEFGETFHDSIIREIAEETGLHVEINDVPVYGWTGVVREKGVQYLGYLFITKYVDGNIVLSPEHTDYKWVNRIDAEQLNMPKDFKRIISGFFDKKFN